MLHKVPESSKRERLLQVVEMQCQLIEGLCSVKDQSRIGLEWLKNLWASSSPEWVTRFWKNDSGNRALWCCTIASATLDEKQTILAVIDQQLQFREIYAEPPLSRILEVEWKTGAFSAAKNLLLAFYDPLFYKDQGFHSSSGDCFHKDHYIDPRPKICPYTDNFLHDVKLDHFLPKDKFPMLSCHPDNLIPCSTDANSGGHKGNRVPLDLTNLDQAESWFHPRWRSAEGTFSLRFPSGSAPQPKIEFVTSDPKLQASVDNMEKMFGVGEFWGGFLDDEVQSVASDIQGWLSINGQPATEESVKKYVRELAQQARNRIGRDGLAIVKSHFYEHIAQTPNLIAQVLRTCVEGT